MGDIELKKFSELAKQRGTDFTKPPYRVPAKDLDENFKKLTPMQQEGSQRPYTVEFTEEGWELKPEVLFDVCENGAPTKFKFLCQKAV